MLGDEARAPDEVWLVLHGYGQLAARFARAFEPLAVAGRLVVAPEALSRFYVDAPAAASHAGARVGATWMTREGREHEIADYVAYLDAVAARVLGGADGGGGRRQPAVHVLGFSQGVATAARWVTRGRTAVQRLTLWGGTRPQELGAEGGERLRRLERVTLVGGERDTLVTPAVLAEQARTLRALGVECELLTFDGGHELDRATLDALGAAAPRRG